MPRGNPDYLILSTQTIRQTDASEYMSAYDIGFARLDQGGRVIWFDDFRAGLYRNALGKNFAGLYPALDTSAGKMFGFHPSAILDPVSLNGQSVMTKLFPAAASGIIGLELAIYMPANHGTFGAEFGAVNNDEVGWFGAFTIQHTTNIVTITTDAGDVPIYTPGFAGYMEDKYIGIKITMDPATGQYQSILIGGTRVDITHLNATDQLGSMNGTAYYAASVFGGTGTKVEPCYVGYVIMTADEP